jgi:hypothetical protein
MDADRDTSTDGGGTHAVKEATALMHRAVDLLAASPGGRCRTPSCVRL